MKIIKHGKKPEEEELYYNCYKCGCQFKATKEESEYFDGINQHDSGYVCKCPECGTACGGMHKSIYLRHYGGGE